MRQIDDGTGMALGVVALLSGLHWWAHHGQEGGRNYADYPFYVVHVPLGMVASGWEYREDADEALDELREMARGPGFAGTAAQRQVRAMDYRVYTQSGVKRLQAGMRQAGTLPWSARGKIAWLPGGGGDETAHYRSVT